MKRISLQIAVIFAVAIFSIAPQTASAGIIDSVKSFFGGVGSFFGDTVRPLDMWKATTTSSGITPRGNKQIVLHLFGSTRCLQVTSTGLVEASSGPCGGNDFSYNSTFNEVNVTASSSNRAFQVRGTFNASSTANFTGTTTFYAGLSVLGNGTSTSLKNTEITGNLALLGNDRQIRVGGNDSAFPNDTAVIYMQPSALWPNYLTFDLGAAAFAQQVTFRNSSTGSTLQFDLPAATYGEIFFNALGPNNVNTLGFSTGPGLSFNLTSTSTYPGSGIVFNNNMALSSNDNASTTISTISQDYMFFVGGSTNRIGIATSTPGKLVDIFSTGTTTLRLDSNSTSKGACWPMKDSDGSGYTYITANNGTLTASTVDCS